VREDALRIQKLLLEVRSQGMLPPANLKGADSVPTAAQRSAAGLGVGDNLKAALTDTHTDHLVMARSWVDGISTDSINGDGSIDPSLAFARVQIHTSGSFSGSGRAVSNPQSLAAETSTLITEAGSAAALSHSEMQAPLFG
jgi:hypothetical protein